MINDITSILTAIGAVLTGLSSALLMILKLARTIRATKSTESASSKMAPWWKRVSWLIVLEVGRALAGMVLFLACLWKLFWLQDRATPLTTGDAATLALCLAICVMVLMTPPRPRG